MIDINSNNELTKPMVKNGDQTYTNKSVPLQNDDDRIPDDMQQNNPNISIYPVTQKEAIIIQRPENERPSNWICFGQESLQNRARMNFVRKVYMLLGLQLLVTIGFCCLSYFFKPFFEFQMNYWWVALVAFFLMYMVMAIIVCTANFRKFPHNVVWLLIFTLCFSYIISQITSAYAYYNGGPLVVIAAGMALFMVIGLTLFALLSRNDYRMLFGILVVIFFSFIGFGLVCIFTQYQILHLLYCAIAVTILGILIVIDTKLIIGGERTIQISMDDYILGSIMLYVDILRIFLLILELLGETRQ